LLIISKINDESEMTNNAPSPIAYNVSCDY